MVSEAKIGIQVSCHKSLQGVSGVNKEACGKDQGKIYWGATKDA